MSESVHYLQLVADDGEIHPRFVCESPEDAPCRRRPDPGVGVVFESWSADQAIDPGHPCWALEWVEAVGLPDAIVSTELNHVYASVPVTIGYDECVEVTPESASMSADRTGGGQS